MENAYAAAPLGPNSQGFRLIQIQSSEAPESEETQLIRCSLRSYSLGDHPPYTALSYVWGPDKDYDNIELNGIQFPVRENLWTFLHQMRLRDHYDPLWVDALCINQSKVHERNHQVQMMQHIYSKAQLVLVWLGDADNTSDIAMEKLKKCKPIDASKSNYSKIWNARQAQSVLSLCKRKYWRRMWIIQEVLLAKEVVISCGTKNLRWTEFEQIFKNLQSIVDRGRGVHTPCTLAVLDSPAAAIGKMRAEWGRTSRPLAKLLQTYGDHECTNPRDKIYALLGIAEDISEVPIDYDKSLKDVFLDVFRHKCNRMSSGIKAEGELIRFGQFLETVLRVPFPDTEIQTQINPNMPSFRDTMLNLVTKQASQPLGDRIIYQCLFRFLACSFLSLDKEQWKTHCRTHFGGLSPPRWVQCSLCSWSQRFDSGWVAWDNRVEHATSHKEPLPSYAQERPGVRPDFHLFEHLWQRGLIDDLDLREVLIGKHCLKMPPLTRSCSSTVWDSEEQQCRQCFEEFKQPLLHSLDHYRIDIWDRVEDDHKPHKSGVIECLQTHINESERAYIMWIEEHRHGVETSIRRPRHIVDVQRKQPPRTPVARNCFIESRSSADKDA